MSDTIRFDNGTTYERYMGRWSQLAGEDFIEWLAPPPRLRWLDVGCGNGAFTELLARRCEPLSLSGVDPSAGMLEFASRRELLRDADLRQGSAMSLPFADASFDAAVLPLVIFFIPDPARGLAEMARVVRPGGMIAAYSWDMEGNGFPYAVLQRELASLGMSVPQAPSPDASREDRARELWQQAGLGEIGTRVIRVQRTFRDFEDYWSTLLGGPSIGATLMALPSDDSATLRERLLSQLPRNADGSITCEARANAIRGMV